jgi:dolichyl-phosphate-mannose-protein mannosyltransferase
MSATSHSSHRLLLGGLFLAGLALRLHGLNEVSLSHYDEGVYVSSGIRVASQGWYEFAFGQPLHAPPLYPWILSLVYWLLQTPWPPVGCYVSALFGAATLPLFYGLVRPRLSPPHALAAVALLAASDVHIAFSRMALTDVPLTFWFVAAMFGFTRLEAAVRRENPGELVVVAGLTGLAVAAAWNTKYTGWMPPAIASVAAGVHVLLPARRAAESPEHAPEKRSATTMRVVLAGAIVLTLAGLLYLPWYWYVQQHFDGGYAAVTAHHQTYLGTWLQWPGRAAQLLISLPAFRHAGWLLLVVASLILWLWPRRTGDWPGPRACWALLSVLVVLAGGDAVMLCAGAAAIPWAVVRGRWLERLASVWLGSLLVLLPFYFP